MMKELDEKTKNEFKFVGLYHMEHDENEPDNCGQQFCERLPTEYMKISLFNIEYDIPLCRNHAEQIEQFIWGKDVIDFDGFPIIYCKDDGKRYYFYCKYCQKIHFHGRGDGHRTSHCITSSPYKDKGYFLKLASDEDFCYGLDEDDEWKLAVMNEQDLQYLRLIGDN